MAWDLLFDRSDLAHTEHLVTVLADPSDGQVPLMVDRVGMTANNVPYALRAGRPGRLMRAGADPGIEGG